MRVLTFDVEDWFHLLDNEATRYESQWDHFETRIYKNMDRILELLEEKNARATFFCLGWVGERYPDLIKKIDALGHEIGSHSYAHQLNFELSPEVFREDLLRSINILEDLTGKKIRSYRSPGFSLTRECSWVFDELGDAGIEIDCSVFPAQRAHGGFPEFGESEPVLVQNGSTRLKVFPLNVWKVLGRNLVFSGGGYFRLLPYPVIKTLTSRSKYVMTYFHPRDFDPDQPQLEGLPLIRKFKSYYGLSSAFEKLAKLIEDFSFVDLAEANSNINWEKARKVNIQAVHN